MTEQLAKLPQSTLIYPGHDYIENNLRFTLNREPDNKSAREMLDKLAGQDPNSAYVSTLEVEGEINTFFRLTSPTVIAKLREGLSRSAREARSAHGVLEAPRTAQLVVSPASALGNGCDNSQAHEPDYDFG